MSAAGPGQADVISLYERAVNSEGPVSKSYEIFLNGVLPSQ